MSLLLYLVGALDDNKIWMEDALDGPCMDKMGLGCCKHGYIGQG